MRRTSPTSRRFATDVARMAADAAAVAGAQGAAGADGDDQSPLRRLHDDYAKPYRSADPGRSRRLVERAVRLLDRTEAGQRPIRLLGVSVHNLCDAAGTAPPDRLPFDDNLVI